MTTVAATECESCQDAGKLGMWLFLASEVMLFGAFLGGYVTLRWGSDVCALGTPAWPEAGRLGGQLLAGANTWILLSSSLTMVLSLISAREGDRKGFSKHLLATTLLGLLFLGVKAYEYFHKIEMGFFPGSALMAATPGLNIFVSFYFAMTGLHALHMIAGLFWIVLLWAAGRRGDLDAGFLRRLEYAGLYWHFVDVVWVFLFPLFYLV